MMVDKTLHSTRLQMQERDRASWVLRSVAPTANVNVLPFLSLRVAVFTQERSEVVYTDKHIDRRSLSRQTPVNSVVLPTPGLSSMALVVEV
jgi:hypothetical protein